MPQFKECSTLAIPVWGLFFIGSMSILTLAKSLFLPLVLAILISLTLSPIVRSLRRRGVPEVLTAGLLMLIGVAIFTISVSTLAEPFSNWLDRFPSQLAEVRLRLSGLIGKISILHNVSESIASVDPNANPNNGDSAIVSSGSSIVTFAATNVFSVGVTTLVTTVLTFFLLAKGRLFYSRILQPFNTLQGKKEALQTVYTIERSISRYLFTITIINILLGAAIAVAMWLLGMANPLLWGLAAAALNFLPFVGALMGIIGSAVVAILTFDSIGVALSVPITYALITGVEGQFITPTFIGRSLAINPVVVFLAVAAWSFMWGLAGALIAVPLLVVIYTISLNVEGLAWLTNFISDDDYGGDEDNSSNM